MCKVDASTINLIVKTSENREFHFRNQRIGSLDDVIEFINSVEILTQFINDDTTFRGDDNQVLTLQHLESAQESGTLNITLSGPDVIDTRYEVHRENLEKAFNITYVDNDGMLNKFMTYLNRKHRIWKNNTCNYVPLVQYFKVLVMENHDWLKK